MKFTALWEVAEMAHKAPIEALKAKVVQVGKQFTGNSNDKDWTKQEVVLTDGQIEVKVKLWDKDLVPHTWKGREATLLSHSGERGLSGVYAFNDGGERIIKVTQTGNIVLAGGAGQEDGGGQEEPPPPRQAQRPPPQQRPAPQSQRPAPQSQRPAPQSQRPAQPPRPAPRQQEAPPPPKTAEQIAAEDKANEVKARKAIARRVHLMFECVKGASYIAEQTVVQSGGVLQFASTDVQKVAVSLYMDCQRDGLHHHLPVTFKGVAPQPKGGAK
jgi:hypothetical protein